MNEEDWQEIVRLIQRELTEVGLSNIADLGQYETQEGSERDLPDGKSLVELMLDALDRELSVRSDTTVRQSLFEIAEVIDEGPRPTAAVVFLGRDRSSIEGRKEDEDLRGDKNIPAAIEELRGLVGQLREIGPKRDELQ